MQGKVNPSGDDVFFLLQSFNTDRTEIAPWSYVIRVDFYQYRVSLYRAFSHCHRFPIRLLKRLLPEFVCRESESDRGYHGVACHSSLDGGGKANGVGLGFQPLR